MSLLLGNSVEVTQEEKDSRRIMTYDLRVQCLTFSQFSQRFFPFPTWVLRKLEKTFQHDCHKLILRAKDNGSVTLNRFPAEESVLPGLVF